MINEEGGTSPPPPPPPPPGDELQPGQIVGRTLDATSGAKLGSATVTIVETGQSATSSTKGGFEIVGVPPGTYTVEVVAPGYHPETVSGVVVEDGKTAKLGKIELTPAPD